MTFCDLLGGAIAWRFAFRQLLRALALLVLTHFPYLNSSVSVYTNPFILYHMTWPDPKKNREIFDHPEFLQETRAQ
jgi:hypothetical protein